MKMVGKELFYMYLLFNFVCTTFAVSFCTLLLSWMMFSVVQSCMESDCNLTSTTNFTADCDSGAVNDYVSCLAEMNCSIADIENFVQSELNDTYPEQCFAPISGK